MNSPYFLKLIITFLYRILRIFLPKPQGLRVLNYHSISKRTQFNEQKDKWYLDEDIFEEHLRFLSKESDMIRSKSLLNEIPESGVIVTLDDGRRDCFEVASPLLIELEIPFSIFIITGFLDKKDYLSINMLKELSSQPLVSIGSHSKNHKRLTECNGTDLKEEVLGSKLFLEDILGIEVSMFSYPHGDFDMKVRESVSQSGYDLAFTSKFNINTKDQDKLLLNRSDIWSTDNLSTFKQKMSGDWDWLKYRGIFLG